MGYCPENLKFNLSYTLHGFARRADVSNFACDDTIATGIVNQFRSFVLHYAGGGTVGTDYGSFTADHYWTGEFRVSPDSTSHWLYLDSEGDYRLHIEDHNDPLLSRSFPPYLGNFANEVSIGTIAFDNCNKDSDGNLLSSCTASSTSSLTFEWNKALLLDESSVVTGADLICRQYISPTITQIGSCTGAPSSSCTVSSGHFTIQRNINVCGPTQAGAESDFDSQVPAGAFDVDRITTSRTIVPEDDFLSSDFLISKSLYDISPLRAELNRLTAKLKHYSDIINCRTDTLESVKEFHSTVIGSANQNSLANARIIPQPKWQGTVFDKFYSAKSNETFFNGIAKRDLGVEASHLFAVDPDNDNLVHHFMVPNRLPGDPFATKFDPSRAGQVGEPEKENFIQSIKAFADKVGAKIEKIRKHFEDDFSFCSELAIQKNQASEAKYVFEGLIYTIEIEYDEVEYSMNDCATKTVVSTTPKTETLVGQTFSIDEEITINID